MSFQNTAFQNTGFQIKAGAGTPADASILSNTMFADIAFMEAPDEDFGDLFQGVQQSVAKDDEGSSISIVKHVVEPVVLLDDDEWTPDWAQAPPTDDLVDCEYPTLVGSVTGTVTPAQSTSFTVTFPTGISVGDLLVVFISNQSGANTTADSAGWTASSKSDGTFQCESVFWKRYAAGDGSSAGFTCTVNTTDAWWCGAYRGVHPTSNPVFSSSFVEGTSATADPPSVTTTWGSDKAKFLAFLSISGTKTVSGIPTGYTTVADVATGSGSVNGDHRAVVASKDDAVGVEDPSAFTQSASGDYSTITMAIRGSCGTGLSSQIYAVPEEEDEPLTDVMVAWPLDDTAVVVDASVLGTTNEFIVDDDDVVVDSALGSPLEDTGNCVFPSVLSVTTGDDGGTTTTSHTVSLPSVSAGDRLYVLFSIRSAAGDTTFPAGWTKQFDDGTGGQSVVVGAYRDCDGTEGASITVSTAPIRACSWHVWRIASGTFDPAEAPVFGTVSTGNSANPDPPSATATWALEPALFIVAAARKDGAGGATVSSYPSNYTDNNNDTVSSTNAGIASASRNLVALTDDPGTFTLSGSMQWSSNTVIIRGVCVDGSIIGSSLAQPEFEEDELVDGLVSSPPDSVEDVAGRSIPDDVSEDDDFDGSGLVLWPRDDAPVAADASILQAASVPDVEDEEPQTLDWVASPLEDAPVANNDIVGKSNELFVDEDEPVTDGALSSPLEDTPADASVLGTSLIVPDDDEEYTDTGFVQFLLADTSDVIVIVTGISINVELGCYHVAGFAAIPDGSGSWAAISNASNSWSSIADGSNAWSAVPNGPGSWVTMPDGSTVWVSEC